MFVYMRMAGIMKVVGDKISGKVKVMNDLAMEMSTWATI